MDYNTVEHRQVLIGADVFGEPLAQDVNFTLTSPATYDYNCIAFAMGVEDRWVDCEESPWHWWPETVPRDRSEECLVAAFEYLGFVNCGMDDSVEPDFEKVALYSKNGVWTHAAKVISNGIYHSKFGASFDGEHSRGDVLAAQYGSVYQVMRRPLSEVEPNRMKMGAAVGVVHLQKKVMINGCEDHLVLCKGHIRLATYGNEVVLLPDGKVALS